MHKILKAQDQFELVINKSSLYRDDFLEERKRLLKVYSSFSSEDVRFTSFAKCVNVLNDLCIGYVTLRVNVIKRAWWKENFDLTDEKAVNQQISEYEMFVRIAFTHLLFSSIESSIRNFARVIMPVQSRNGTAKFYDVYPELLRQLSLTQFSPLLQLLANIRNTVHNNGVFFPGNQTNQSVTYNNVTYNFEVGKSLDFIGSRFILDFAPDLKTMLTGIVESPAVVALGSIRDLASVP